MKVVALVLGALAAMIIAGVALAGSSGSQDLGRRLSGPFCINKDTGVILSVAKNQPCKAGYIRKYGAGQRAKQAHDREKKLARIERVETMREIVGPVMGFGEVWSAVIDDFVGRYSTGGLQFSINDGGARPDTVSLRLAQAVRLLAEGGQ